MCAWEANLVQTSILNTCKSNGNSLFKSRIITVGEKELIKVGEQSGNCILKKSEGKY